MAVSAGTGETRTLVEGYGGGSRYLSWSLAPDRRMFVCLAQNAGSATLELRSAYSGNLRWEHALFSVETGEGKADAGFVPPGDRLWVLAGGQLTLVDYQNGEETPMEPASGMDSFEPALLSFSPDGRSICYCLEDMAPGGLSMAEIRGCSVSGARRLIAEDAMAPLQEYGGYKLVDIEWLSVDSIAVLMEGSGREADVMLVLELGYEGAVAAARKPPAPPVGRTICLASSPASQEVAVLTLLGDEAGVTMIDGGGSTVRRMALPGRGWNAPLRWGPS